MHRHVIRPLNSDGFTLIELITTLSIASILLAIGVPSFQTLTQNSRMTATVNTIAVQLNLARSEAVKRKTRIIMCPSSDGLDCEDTIIWDEGIIMFTDNNKNGHLDPGEDLLKHTNAQPKSIRISTTVGRKKAVYDANGFSMGNNVTFTFCDITEQTDPKAVIVSNSGRARISPTNSQGDPLDCS